jgi:hypothetical protein
MIAASQVGQFESKEPADRASTPDREMIALNANNSRIRSKVPAGEHTCVTCGKPTAAFAQRPDVGLAARLRRSFDALLGRQGEVLGLFQVWIFSSV